MGAWRKGNRLPLVTEHDARGRTAEIYGDIKAALGVPHVSLIFQSYAAFPPFLELHWTRLRPLVASCEFFALADRLRADAYTRMHNYFQIPDLTARIAGLGVSKDERQEIDELIELFQYVNPLLLLLEAAQLHAFDAPVGQPGQTTPAAPHPTFPVAPVQISEEAATPAVRKLYADIKHALDLPFVGTTFRALARWPEFLRVYWEAMFPILQSPMYTECLHGVRETAFGLTRELPGMFTLSLDELADAGMKDDDVTSVVRITEVFARDLPAMLLQVQAAKIGLEGGTRRPRRGARAPAGKAPEAAA